MKVNSNIQGMIAQTILASNETKMQKSTQKMSSGYKLNRAMDNPAGMAISNRMRAQLQSLDRANKNAKNAVNAVQTADGALNEVHAMLQRMNELSIQAANGTLSDSDRASIQEEVNQLSDEITRISKNTTYNTQPLLDGSQALKGYVTTETDASVYSVRSCNEDFPNGKYRAEYCGDVDKDGKFYSTIKLWEVNGSTQKPLTVQSMDATVFMDDYENPTQINGASIKITLPNGGEVTIDGKVSKAFTAGSDDTHYDFGWNNKLYFEINGYGGMKIQSGADQGQEVKVVIPEVSLKTLNFVDLDGNRTLDVSTEVGATKAISQIDKAIKYVSAVRSKIGAYQNRIEKTISNLDVSIENLTESYSTIKDLDMAEGMVDYTRLQVLVQAGTTMLAQANEQPQQALQLLQ